MQNKKKVVGFSPTAWIILLGAAAKFAIHMFTGTRYGYMMDELYTIALSRHLAFGYVDLPPLVPLLVAISRSIFGESLPALHIFPALAGAGTLVFACLITREFGGKAFAVGLTALGFLAASFWLIVDSFFAYDSIDQLILGGFLFTLVRFLRTGNRKLWILLGLIAGLACLTKMTILFMGPGFLAGLLASKYRKDLLSPWPWIGAALCLIVVSPYLLWQAANEWPTLEYWMSYGTSRLYPAPFPVYLTNILFTMNPVLSPLFAVGLYRIFRRIGETRYLFLGVTFLTTLTLLFFLHARTWMLAALFLPLLAAGALAVEEWTAGKIGGKILKPAVLVAALAGGILVAPVTLPFVPVNQWPVLAERLGFLYQPIREWNFSRSEYPETFVLRIGWEELVQDVAGIYNDLPEEERGKAGIYARSYPAAAAIDLFGPRYGLPNAVSGHLTYFFWGPGESWDVLIVVTGRTNELAPLFETCEQKMAVDTEYSSVLSQQYIFVCRNPKAPLEYIWPKIKWYF
jgi:4-amino-4-deoxy-L-arabinose transferase-like glycosyltransferase